jgi:chromosome segregation ATPase
VSEVDSNVQVKYHKALKQIENMHKDNTDLKNDLNQAVADINAWKAKFDALERTKNREMEEVKSSFENSKRFEIERELREFQSKYQNERGIFELEMKRAKDAIEAKNKEIEDLRLNISQFSRKMQDYSKVAERYEDLEGKIGMATEEIERLNRVLKDRNAELRDSQNRVPEFENKVALLSQEIERLNLVIEKKNAEIRNANKASADSEENLRQATAQLNKFKADLNDFRSRLGSAGEESESYKLRVQKLLGENSGLGEEIRNAQENLRLSSSQLGKLQNEFKSVCVENDELKKRVAELENNLKRFGSDSNLKLQTLSQECERLNLVIEKKNGEIRALGGEIQEHQENLRLSALQINKFRAEVNDIRSALGSTSEESESYKQRIQKLLGENSGLGEEIRNAQENLRLSAGQMGKLQNEFKNVCMENDELRKKLGEYDNGIKRLSADS